MTRAATRAQGNKKAASKKRNLPGNLVYFGYKRGKCVVESADRKIIELQNGRSRDVREPGLTVYFTHGVSDGLNPDIPEHAVKIKALRKLIADAEKNGYRGEYGRVRSGNLREVRPNSPAPPFGTWDETSADRLPGIVKDLRLDVEHCIEYESYNQARDEVIDALEALLDQPDNSDPLASSV